MQKLTEYTLGKTVIEKRYDHDCDTDDLGTYTEKYQPGCIIRFDKSFYEDHMDDDDYEPVTLRREYSFFLPPDNGEVIGSPDYRKYALQYYNEMEDLNNNRWCFIGIIISTTIHTDTGLSDKLVESLGGIENHWDKESDIYHNEVIDDLKTELKVRLLKFGFSDDEITKTLNDTTMVEYK